MSATTTNAVPVRIPAAQQPLKSQAKWKRVIIAVLAMLYVISPLDLIPDFIPVIGWLDDLGVLVWAARQVFFNKTI